MKLRWYSLLVSLLLTTLVAILALVKWISPEGMIFLLAIFFILEWLRVWLLKKAIPHHPEDTSLIEEFNDLTFSWRQSVKELQNGIHDKDRQITQWREILKTIPFPILMINKHGEILFSNNAFLSFFGEKRFCWELPSHQFTIAMEKLIAQQGGKSETLTIKDRYFLLFLQPITENSYFLLMVDKTEEVLREEKEKDFIACAAHELKTPLTAILGYLELLEPTITSSQREDFETILRHVKRLVSLTHDLFSLSRWERTPLVVERFSLTEMANRISSLFRPRFKAKGITFALDIPQNLSMEGDSVAIEEIFFNLLENALRYTEKGSVSLTIQNHKNSVSIHICDTGIGIDKKHLPRLFERFYVVDKARSRETGGTGLGLAIVKSIVERYHGSIQVKSEPGKGSCFSVILPLEQDEQHARKPV